MSDPIFKVTSLKDFKKFGFITPSSNVALEIITTAILAQLPLVSCHYSRVPVITLDVASGAGSQFRADTLAACAKLIANCPVEAVLWNGTSESWTGEGYEGGVHIKDAIEKGTGLPSSTSSLAQVEVLKLWKVKKIALATPYNADNNRRLSEYYGSCGFEVVNDSRLDIKNNNDIADTPLETMRKLIREADHPDAECIVVPCTNFPVAFLVEEMEEELGKPVFDSIIVTLWKALRIINIETPIHGWGILLRANPILAKLDQVMSDLRENTNGSRTTLRIDVPKYNCVVDRVVAESTAPGIPSLRSNTSLNQRAAKTCQWIEETGQILVQGDTINAEIPPPAVLLAVYQVKAQMLIPLMSGKNAYGWISIHYVPSTRGWTEEEVSNLRTAGQTVCSILKDNGWADLTVN
jgi:maleate isomerase